MAAILPRLVGGRAVASGCWQICFFARAARVGKPHFGQKTGTSPIIFLIDFLERVFKELFLNSFYVYFLGLDALQPNIMRASDIHPCR